MWKLKHFLPKEQTGLDRRTFDIGNLKIQVKNAIAEGGFSCVYIARDVHTGKQYALKHIICNDGESLDLVKKEIAVMISLKGHPNVVTLYEQTILDMGRTKEAFLVMEFCEKSLVTVLENRGAGYYEENQILLIFRDVCNAVYSMHCQSPPIAHRDLKAENVLIGPDGTWKLCDFGSTSTNHKRFERAEEMGIEEDNIRKYTTPAYRAPEMWDLFRRELINEKVDIWALGCLLFRICYFKSAFDGESKLQILNGNYRIPEQPKYSSAVTGLIKDMLQGSPDARPDIMQVWRRVNEQLPLDLQKHRPDRPSSVPTSDATLHFLDGHTQDLSPHLRRGHVTPTRTAPPPPMSREQVYSSSPIQNFEKASGSSGKLGAFWATQHAQDSSSSLDKGPMFDEEPTAQNSITSGIHTHETRRHTIGSIVHETEHPRTAPKRNAQSNMHKKRDDGPKEGFGINFFPENGNNGSDKPINVSRPSSKDVYETVKGSQTETFASFVADFQSNKDHQEKDNYGKEDLLAEVDRLKEELKQVYAEKSEIASKYGKLMAICRSQRQEIQELKQAAAAGAFPQSKDGSKTTAGPQAQVQQPQKSSGPPLSSNQPRDKIEGSIWELQQGMLASNLSTVTTPEPQTWQAFADNQDSSKPARTNPKSVRTEHKNSSRNININTNTGKTSDSWGFDDERFSALPKGNSVQMNTTTTSSTMDQGNSQRFGNISDANQSQPAGWAGF